MKKNSLFKKVAATALSVVMGLSVIAVGVPSAFAAKKKYVKSISVAKSKVTVNAGKSTKVKVTVKVSGSASKKFTVKTSNKKVATAKVSGQSVKISAKNLTKKKTATITVTTKAKSKKGKKLSKKIKVTVKPTVVPETTPTEAPTAAPTEAPTETPTDAPVVDPTEAPTAAPADKLEKITVTAEPAVISEGATSQIKVVSDTPGVEIAKVEYQSSNEYTATVNSSGIVSGLKANNAPVVITVKAYDAAGNVVSGTVNVTVNAKIDAKISGVEDKLALFLGGTKKLNPIVEGAEANFTYASSDEAVATVAADGTITAVGNGTANITVTVTGTAASAVCVVTVTDSAPGIASFKAVHADTLRVELTAPISADDHDAVKVTLKKGITELKPVVKWDGDAAIVLTTDSDFEGTGYTVEISSDTVSLDSTKLKAEVELEKRDVKQIKITTNAIPKANGAKIYFNALDNYGDPIKNITADKFTWTLNCSRPDVDLKLITKIDVYEGYLALDGLKNIDEIKVDDTSFNVKAEYKDNPIEINDTAKVDVKSLLVESIVLEGLEAGKIYENATEQPYVLTYTAKDNYGNDIDWSLYAAGAYNNQFTAQSSNPDLVSAPSVYEGKLQVKVAPDKDGEATITIQGNDLKTSSLKIDVLKAPVPIKIKFPEEKYTLIAGDSSMVKLPITFVDQYGDDIIAGNVSTATYQKLFKKTTNAKGTLTYNFVPSKDGDYINLSAKSVTEAAKNVAITYTAYDMDGNTVVSEYRFDINEARKPNTIVIKNVKVDETVELVTGEQFKFEIDVLDNHGEKWTGGDVSFIFVVKEGAAYISSIASGVDKDGNGYITVEALKKSYKTGADLQFYIEMYYKTELVYKTSDPRPIVIYDNLSEIVASIENGEYKSGQTVALTLKAYNKDEKSNELLTTYNKTYKEVEFKEYDEKGNLGGTQLADVTFVDGVATVNLTTQKAGKIYFTASIPAVGKSSPITISTKSTKIDVVPSDAVRYAVDLTSSAITITCLDKNDNVKTDYKPTESTYITLENVEEGVKASDYIENVMSSDSRAKVDFVDGVATLNILKALPKDAVVKVTTDAVTGSKTVK